MISIVRSLGAVISTSLMEISSDFLRSKATEYQAKVHPEKNYEKASSFHATSNRFNALARVNDLNNQRKDTERRATEQKISLPKPMVTPFQSYKQNVAKSSDDYSSQKPDKHTDQNWNSDSPKLLTQKNRYRIDDSLGRQRHKPE